MWRLELYPDEVLVRDPFEQPQPGKVVSRLLYRSWPMALHLPDLGAEFFVTPITVPDSNATLAAPTAQKAAHAKFLVTPGVWLLATHERIDPSTLPARIARVGLAEYHLNERRLVSGFHPSLVPGGISGRHADRDPCARCKRRAAG